ENHIQYHGGFLEDKEFHTSVANQERGYFYRMGIRHYSPMLGQFLQKDPFTIARAPSKMTPLSVNPYIYAYNRPLQLSDTSGYQPGGWDIMPAEGGSFGGGFGTDGGGGGLTRSPFRNLGGGSGGGGNGEGGTEEGEERQCAVYYPSECIDRESSPDPCFELCCLWDDEPSWTDACCGDSRRVDILWNHCHYTSEGDCDCKCCWAGDGENAPAAMGGGSMLGGTGGSTVFGPPNIGPWGDGGDPWDNIELIPLSIKAPGYMYPPWYKPGNPRRLPSSVGTTAGIGVLAALAGYGLTEACNRGIPMLKKYLSTSNICNIYLNCLCPACEQFTNCWNRCQPLIIGATIFGVVVGGIAGFIGGGIIGILPGIAGGAGFFGGGMAITCLSVCLYEAVLSYWSCIESYAAI
ncbi:hypothetical protein J7L05_07315, partial [bacterium]|nr:hypothetical protein [bacterium]